MLAIAASAVASFAPLPAHSQQPATYPTRPIRFIVPYPPGGPTDLMARMLQPAMQQRLGVPVVIENKGGAGGNLGTTEVARQAPADGYTILLAASGPMAVNASLYKTLSFDPIKDLAPVVQLSAFPLVLEVNPTMKVKTVAELLARIKSESRPLNYASAGNGTPQHLAGEMFDNAMHVKMNHVPYRGAGPALVDLLGAQVDLMFDILGSSLQYIESGKLVPLAVTSNQRSPQLPNVPTMAEAGVTDYGIVGWHGIAVRTGTPQPMIDRLNATFLDIFKDPTFRKNWEGIGTPVVAGTPAAFGELIASDSKRLGKLVRDAGVTAD